MSWLNVEIILLLAAFVLTLVAAIGRAPIWIAVLLLVILSLLKALPGR